MCSPDTWKDEAHSHPSWKWSSEGQHQDKSGWPGGLLKVWMPGPIHRFSGSAVLISCPVNSDVGESWKLCLTLWLSFHWAHARISTTPGSLPLSTRIWVTSTAWISSRLFILHTRVNLPESVTSSGWVIGLPTCPQGQAPWVESISSVPSFLVPSFSPGPIIKPKLINHDNTKSPLSQCPHDWNPLVNHQKLRFLKIPEKKNPSHKLR